ncbi:hypothetical protein [Nostoc sp. CHAB 5715]|uniref:hypothetical protein n=1 Tax=Nostoc sp. CHAB 5715 TaxID=2780400 RepID=UPI001E48109A|nr:hypothetical protein [Nostoc sp. CHAB 5715]MCC5623794.1 hypothetical protein [Nostoc sp. CHAB 5715]
MSKQKGIIKIFRSIFAAVNLALISGVLVSCVEVPQPSAPTEQRKPVIQPNQNDEDDDNKDGDRNNDKDDDDKDDND